VNYDLSLGFILAFLLGAAGIQSMLHTFRNLAHLRITAGRVAPVFAGEPAQFQLNILNPTRADRFSIGVTGDRVGADYIDVPAETNTVATVAVPAAQRGWLRPGRMMLFTRFPVGLFRAWSYAEPDVHCLVYPKPAAPGIALPPPAAGNGEGGLAGRGQDEFSGLRPYRTGDSPRHVAWKAVARDDNLLTKQFAGLADANANVSLAITNDDERREGEAASALYYLRYAINLHDLLCEGQLRRVNSRHLSALLELKPGSPGSVCERLQAPMIFKSCAVEDDLRHTGGLRALGNEGSDFGSLLHLRALGIALHLCIER
jgi:uncharacterized protein (DUF58 family)